MSAAELYGCSDVPRGRDDDDEMYAFSYHIARSVFTVSLCAQFRQSTSGVASNHNLQPVSGLDSGDG